MANQLTVTLVNGVPTAPSGTVSTIDALMADGGQATLGVTTGPAVITDATGTLQGYLRGLVKLIAAAVAGVSGALFTKLADGSGNLITSTTGAIDVNIKSGAGSGGTAITDEAAFTEGTTSFTPIGGVFKTSQTALTTGQGGAVALSAAREMETLGKVWDGTNTATVKPASTAAASTDTALVVAIHPLSQTANGQATSGNSLPVVLSTGQSFAGQNQTAPANTIPVGAQFNTVPTTLTSGNVSPLQIDNAGNLLVNIKAGASSGAVAQGSTTSGQTGSLVQGAVTTANPSYTTAQTSPLSLDAAGNLRVGVAPGTSEVAATGVTIGTSGVGYLGWLSSIAKLLSNALTVTLSAATSGGLTETGILTTAIAVVGNVKASAGQLYKVEVSNNSASWVYLKLYNTAGTPTAGSGTPQRRIGIPPSSTLLSTTDLGGVYSTGIGYALTGVATDADTTAVAANIAVNFHWK